ncbi:MAG TPA: hypothetical protein VFH89_08855 [Sphingomicrobium sp.]|nr:hypothetical protein [Sphingomicrobium sp.]
MTSKQILVALSMAMITAPAAAQTSAPKTEKAPADQKKYCIQYENIVGSRVSRQECKTKAEWARDHVDVDKLLKE